MLHNGGARSSDHHSRSTGNAMKLHDLPKCIRLSVHRIAVTLFLGVFAFSPMARSAVYYLTADQTGTYTSDGTNTWNPLDAARIDTVSTSFTMADSTGSTAAGLTWTVRKGNSRGEAWGTSPTLPSLPWFNTSEAGQTESYRRSVGLIPRM